MKCNIQMLLTPTGAPVALRMLNNGGRMKRRCTPNCPLHAKQEGFEMKEIYYWLKDNVYQNAKDAGLLEPEVVIPFLITIILIQLIW